ncbi:hypothetical protein F8388_027031 [Cannabis sativa]|uniref:Uncharacterized protein n=1 Tax=Cannabis sativa TaxID=3483 RepID=A0A7J6FNZ9_CANSA|nr:hypothetical protein F8388_027031 [Cannabis sativa]
MGRTISALPTFLVYTTFVFTFALAQSSSILPQPQSLASLHSQQYSPPRIKGPVHSQYQSKRAVLHRNTLAMKSAFHSAMHMETRSVISTFTGVVTMVGNQRRSNSTVITSKPFPFYYNTFIPNGVWYGFNLCNAVSGLASSA